MFNKSDIVVDEMNFDPVMHFSLLTVTKGVSLERISYFRDSYDQTNWHSASEPSGFATPGYQNSEFFSESSDGEMVSIEPEIFSPDDDGYNDVLEIHYNTSSEGWVANVRIYDSQGRQEKLIINNQLIGKSGTISWDGINGSNQRSKIGIYFLYFELFDLKGNFKKFKRPFVLAGKLK